jgi:hypothetical protein
MADFFCCVRSAIFETRFLSPGFRAVVRHGVLMGFDCTKNGILCILYGVGLTNDRVRGG